MAEGDKKNDDGNKDDGNKDDGNKDTGNKDEGGKKEPETYNVKIGGEDKLLTLEELKEHATKSAGADKLMRDASDIRKESKDGIRIKEAFEKVMTSDDVDVGDIRQLATVMGIDPDEMEKVFNEELEKLGVKKDDKSLKKPEKIGKDQLDDETRDILEQARAQQVKEAEALILEECKKAIDKDDSFGKIIEETEEEQRDDRAAVIVNMVHRDVRAKILASPWTGEKFGADMLQNSIQTVRAELKKYGIPSKSSKQLPLNIFRGGGLGLAGDLPSEVTDDKDVERVPSTEAGYDDNVVKRLGQKMVRSALNRRKK